MEKVWHHPSCKKFILVAKELKDHLVVSDYEPVELLDKYFEALFYYRYYLDSIGFKMSSTKKPFIFEDKTTWRYLDVVVKNDKYVGVIENHQYCYKDKT